jgi:3-oxoacyl-[acyl-carrier-protein] synthase II
MNTSRVVITGLGVISSIGIGWQQFWDSLLKGKSGISPVSSFDTTNHFTHNGGEVKDFKPEEFISKEHIESMNRSTLMALAATKLAIEDSGLTQTMLSKITVGVSLGTTLGDAQTIEEIDDLFIKNRQISKNLIFQIPTYNAPSEIAREYSFFGPLFMFTTACAAGNYAICYGYDLIKSNRAEIVLAGASDAFSRIEYTGFNQISAVAPEKCKPFDKNRKGMLPAEGAGILVLESYKNALERKALINAEIIGYGLSCDANHMTNPSVEGISKCMRKAIKETGVESKEIDYISAHGTGTIANDKAECSAIKDVFGSRYKKIPISSIKSMLGHTMGAASALEAIVCALAIKNDVIPPTINFETPDPECDIDCVPNQARKHIVNVALNNSYAFGGNNASLVLKEFIH